MNYIHGLASNTGGWIRNGHIGTRITSLPQIDEDNTSNHRLIESKKEEQLYLHNALG